MDQRRRIVRHLLLSSPPGQFDLILSDLRNIVSSSSVLSDEFVQKVSDEYNQRNNISTVEEKASDNGLSRCILVEIENYMNKVHSSSTRTSKNASSSMNFSCDTSEDAKSYVLKMRSERINLKNYYAGSWTSTFTLNMSGEFSGNLSGEVDIVAHYFENGNVQLRSKKTFNTTITEKENKEVFAKAVLKHIQVWEEDQASKLSEMYQSMNSNTLKRMRRILPVSRTKMDWNLDRTSLIGLLKKEVSHAIVPLLIVPVCFFNLTQLHFYFLTKKK